MTKRTVLAFIFVWALLVAGCDELDQLIAELEPTATPTAAPPTATPTPVPTMYVYLDNAGALVPLDCAEYEDYGASALCQALAPEIRVFVSPPVPKTNRVSEDHVVVVVEGVEYDYVERVQAASTWTRLIGPWIQKPHTAVAEEDVSVLLRFGYRFEEPTPEDIAIPCVRTETTQQESVFTCRR